MEEDFECRVDDIGTCPENLDFMTQEPFEDGSNIIKFNFRYGDKIIKECFEIEGIFRYIFGKILSYGDMDYDKAETPKRNKLSESQVNRLKNCYFQLPNRQYQTMQDFINELNVNRERESQEGMQRAQEEYGGPPEQILLRNIQHENQAIEHELRRLRDAEQRNPGTDNQRTNRIADLERRIMRTSERENNIIQEETDRQSRQRQEEEEDRLFMELENQRIQEIRDEIARLDQQIRQLTIQQQQRIPHLRHIEFIFEDDNGNPEYVYIKRENYQIIVNWLEQKFPFIFLKDATNWRWSTEDKQIHSNGLIKKMERIYDNMGQNNILRDRTFSQQELYDKLDDFYIHNHSFNYTANEDNLIGKIINDYQPNENRKYFTYKQLSTIIGLELIIHYGSGDTVPDWNFIYNVVMDFLNRGRVVNELIEPAKAVWRTEGDDESLIEENINAMMYGFNVNNEANRSIIGGGKNKNSRKTIKKTSRKLIKKTSRKISRKAIKKTSRKISRKPIKKISRKISRKAIKKTSRKTSTKHSTKIIRNI